MAARGTQSHAGLCKLLGFVDAGLFSPAYFLHDPCTSHSLADRPSRNRKRIAACRAGALRL